MNVGYSNADGCAVRSRRTTERPEYLRTVKRLTVAWISVDLTLLLASITKIPISLFQSSHAL